MRRTPSAVSERCRGCRAGRPAGRRGRRLDALAPDEFTAVRNARAKAVQAEGNRDLAASIRALAKPTAGAWLANQLVRRDPAALDPLLDLGRALRDATARLDGAEMRSLSRQQAKVVGALVRRAAELGTPSGKPVTPGVAHDLEDTLRAAISDADAADQLMSGRSGQRPAAQRVWSGRPGQPQSRADGVAQSVAQLVESDHRAARRRLATAPSRARSARPGQADPGRASGRAARRGRAGPGRRAGRGRRDVGRTGERRRDGRDRGGCARAGPRPISSRSARSSSAPSSPSRGPRATSARPSSPSSRSTAPPGRRRTAWPTRPPSGTGSRPREALMEQYVSQGGQVGFDRSQARRARAGSWSSRTPTSRARWASQRGARRLADRLPTGPAGHRRRARARAGRAEAPRRGHRDGGRLAADVPGLGPASLRPAPARRCHTEPRSSGAPDRSRRGDPPRER